MTRAHDSSHSGPDLIRSQCPGSQILPRTVETTENKDINIQWSVNLKVLDVFCVVKWFLQQKLFDVKLEQKVSC